MQLQVKWNAYFSELGTQVCIFIGQGAERLKIFVLSRNFQSGGPEALFIK